MCRCSGNWREIQICIGMTVRFLGILMLERLFLDMSRLI